MSVRLLVGDCRASLRTLPDGCVQACITSPPYWGLRCYSTEPQVWADGWRGELGGEPSPSVFVAHLVEVFAEVHRVLRPDGVCFVNISDSYASDPAKGGSGTPNGRNNRGEGYPRPGLGGLKPKDLCLVPQRLALALQEWGWWVRCDIIWWKRNAMPDSVTDRPTRAHEYVWMLAKSERYYWDQEAVREKPADYTRRGGTATCTANGAASHGVGSDSLHQMAANGRNLRSVLDIPTQPFSARDLGITSCDHYAAFPEELARRLILASTPPGAVVLDPFAGTGTTGAVAVRHGRDAILCELNPEYAEIAAARCRREAGLFTGPVLAPPPVCEPDAAQAAFAFDLD